MVIMELSEAIEVLRIFSHADFSTSKDRDDSHSLERELFKEKIESKAKSEEYQEKIKIEHLESILKNLIEKYHVLAEKEINPESLQELRSRIHDCKRKIFMIKSKNK